MRISAGVVTREVLLFGDGVLVVFRGLGGGIIAAGVEGGFFGVGCGGRWITIVWWCWWIFSAAPVAATAAFAVFGRGVFSPYRYIAGSP